MSPDPEDPVAPGRGKAFLVVAAAVVVVAGAALIVAGLRSGGQGSDPKRAAASAAPEPTEASPAAAPSGPGPRDADQGQASLPTSPDPAQFLRAGCASNVGADGFASFRIDAPLAIAHQSLDLGRPCKLHLRGKGALTLSGVKLRSGHLYITDDDDEADAASLVIEDSSLVGQVGSALAVSFSGPADRVSITNSSLDYPAALAISVPGAGPPPARVELSDTVLRSADSASHGIDVAARELHYQRLGLEAAPGGRVLILADQCVGVDMTGAAPRCKSR